MPRLQPLDERVPLAARRHVDTLRQLLQITVRPVIDRVEEARIERGVRMRWACPRLARHGRRPVLVVRRHRRRCAGSLQIKFPIQIL